MLVMTGVAAVVMMTKLRSRHTAGRQKAGSQAMVRCPTQRPRPGRSLESTPIREPSNRD